MGNITGDTSPARLNCWSCTNKRQGGQLRSCYTACRGTEFRDTLCSKTRSVADSDICCPHRLRLQERPHGKVFEWMPVPFPMSRQVARSTGVAASIGKPLHVAYLNWINPVLTLRIAFFDGHMRRLISLVAVKKEADAQQAQGCRHRFTFSLQKQDS